MKEKLFKDILSYYQINEDDYLLLTKEYDLSSFWNGAEFKYVDKAANVLKSVMNNKGKIVIYGDYDADGIMGVSILKKMFNYLNYEVGYYVPSRYIDGYGITLERAKQFVEKGYSLVITVDNGISAFEPIEYLKNNNVKVIVIDHHLIGDKLPNCDAIVHPIYCESGLNSSGAFSAYVFATNVLNRNDKYLSILASISLISDSMPLIGYNRNFLKAVFKSYINDEFLNISLLCEGKKLNEEVVSSKVSPKINSIGRMLENTSINNIIPFFTEENKDKVITYYDYICSVNSDRKTLSTNILQNLNVDCSSSAIVEVLDVKEGLIGLLSTALLTKYHKPTIIFTLDNSKQNYKGSARSANGFNIVKAFDDLNDLLVAYGGHQNAGGCTLPINNFEQFKKRFNELANHIDEVVEEKTIPMNISDINKESYELIKTFSPFGEGWPKPQFKIEKIKSSSLNYSKTGEHIVTSLGNSSKIVGFNISKEMVSKYNFVDIIGDLDLNDFYATASIDFKIKQINESKI